MSLIAIFLCVCVCGPGSTIGSFSFHVFLFSLLICSGYTHTLYPGLFFFFFDSDISEEYMLFIFVECPSVCLRFSHQAYSEYAFLAGILHRSDFVSSLHRIRRYKMSVYAIISNVNSGHLFKIFTRLFTIKLLFFL